MPTRVNGIGTAYHGAANKQVFDGTCEHCRRAGKLRHYETRLWFTVLYIPLIPLKRQQILNYCPSCTWHQAIPFVEWERVRDQAVQESADKWAENRADPEAAMQMHSTLASFQKRAEAERLAGLMLERFGNDPKVQFYVGGWYEHIGKGTEADGCFARAFELDPESLPARRAFAMGKIEQGDLAKARGLLKPFEPPSESFDPGVFYLLGKAYQRQDQHQEALDVFRMLLTASPGLARDKEFRKQMRRSERALGIETSAVPSDPFYRSPVFGWTAAIVAVLLGILGWNFYIERHRTVHVVNGLPIPVSVQIDGAQPLEIGPGARYLATVAEGPHEARIVTPAGRDAPTPFVVSSGWFDRFFKKPAWVLDPTRSAAVYWQSAEYSARPAGNGAGRSLRWHVGQALTSYPHVDYLFQEFPDSLKVDNASEKVTKTRLDVAGVEPSVVIGTIASTQGLSPDLLPYIEAQLEAQPDDRVLVAIYNVCATEHPEQLERCRKFVAARVGDRPIRVDWHRCHQDMAQRARDEEALIQEYDALLAKEPENSMLLYLRGRIDPDDHRADEYFSRAIAADPQNASPWYAQGYRDHAIGRFDEARQKLSEACRLKPDDPQMQSQLLDVRFACGEFEPLIAEFREKLKKEPHGIGTHLLLLEALTAVGRPDEAQAVHEQFVASTRGPQGEPWLANQSEMYLLYLEGKFPQLLNRVAQIEDPSESPVARFQARLEMGDLEDLTVAGVSKLKRPAQMELLLSLAWSRKKNAERSQEARNRAIELLKGGSHYERRAADLLAQGPQLPAGAGEALLIDVDMKQVVLAALADGCPEQRESLLALAEKLNYRRDFPHHFLKRVMEKSRISE